MKSIPEQAKYETGLTFHRPDRISEVTESCTFTLSDEAHQQQHNRKLGIRFIKIKSSYYAQRYTRVRTGERKTKYRPCTLLIGFLPGKHKAVRNMISIKERVQYDFLNEYQPLIYRR